jgi:hypothetical protein
MKGIAIQTILLLLVGVLVVGILVYMVYRYTAGKTLSAYDCKALFVGWCTNCYNTKGTGTTKVGETISKCLLDTMGIDFGKDNDCTTAKSYCQQVGVTWE